MKLLLDTHIFIWFVNDEPQLSRRARALIEDPDNDVYVSLASLWEMAIKFSAGKLRLDPDFDGFVATHIPANNFSLLPIETRHLSEVSRLPFHHRDPFDRLLAAQTRADNLTLLSADAAFDAYGLTRQF